MLNLINLDGETREFMLDELDHDVRQVMLYYSPRLTQSGKVQYEGLLRQAITAGSDATLSRALAAPGILEEQEERQTKKGVALARVPVTAPQTLAEGEFNRFYARGLCRRAVSEGLAELEVYRAKAAKNPRPESEAKIGTRLDPEALLEDLRMHPGVEPALGLPPGPNSGLSVKFPYL